MTRNSQRNDACLDRPSLQEIKAHIDVIIRDIVPPSFSYDDRDDLAQSSWIKYWHITQMREITYPKAYMRCIVHSIFVTMLRQQQRFAQLPLVEDGEIDQEQGRVLVESGVSIENPEQVLEQALAITDRMEEVMSALEKLPPRQRKAMICALWEKVDDLILYITALQAHQIDGSPWPEERAEKQLLQASCAPARIRMADIMHIDLRTYRHWKVAD